MTRISTAVAPAMLMAAGTIFAGSANGASMNLDFTITPSYQTVQIGDSFFSTQLYVLGGEDETTPYASMASFRPESSGTGVVAVPGPLFNDVTFFSSAPGIEADASAYYSTCIASAAPLHSDSYAQIRFLLDGETQYGVVDLHPVANGAVVNLYDGDYLVDTVRLGKVVYKSQADAAAVPEPATWAEMIGGLGAVGGAMRTARRRKTQLAKA